MAKITHMIPDLTNGVTYYGKVYSVNPKKRANGRADLTVFAAVPSEFPAEPSEYLLIDTYTSAQTWVAPEDGWYKIEVFGASGNGGTSARPDKYTDEYEEEWRIGATGGGGASGGYSSSAVKLSAGDIVVLTPAAVGATSTAVVNSSVDESHTHTISVTSGGNGGNGRTNGENSVGGTGGAKGAASGGNLQNLNGNAGSRGGTPKSTGVGDGPYPGGAGGAAVVDGGNVGGAGGGYDKSGLYLNPEVCTSPGSGKKGFVKISRGSTNVTA